MCKKYHNIRYKLIKTCKNRLLKYVIDITLYKIKDYYYGVMRVNK